jgi:hypothetical protein
MGNEEKDVEASPPPSEQYTPTNIGLWDWTSENDPDDPHNWPAGKRAYHAGITAAFAFTTYVLKPANFFWSVAVANNYTIFMHK